MKIKPVIMAGGVGTRLWPLSRQLCPKQFIKMFDNFSLLQKTLIRNQFLGKPALVIRQEHEFIVTEQTKEIAIEVDLIIEPIPKSTAACMIIATLQAKNEGADIVVLLPSDHHISNNDQYLNTINKSLNYAQKFGICTIGIPPNFPNIEYGYIKTQATASDGVFKIVQFIEKPSLLKAKDYLKQGGYFWNSGILIYNVGFMLAKTKLLQPKLFDQVCKSFYSATTENNSTRFALELYSQIEAISVDYAIMEYISQICMLKSDFQWIDLGNWQSLWQIRKKDAKNNYCEGDIIVSDTTNSYINSNGKLITVIGLDNVIIINTDDVLLVADKTKITAIKQIVTYLTKCGRKEV